MFFFSKYKQLDENRKKIFMNVFWAMLGKVVNMGASLFVGILVARYLGPNQYGLMNYVISFVAIFSVFASFGLTNIEVRELAKSPEHKGSILGTCFVLRLFFSTIAYCIIICIVFLANSDSESRILILLYGLSLFSTNCFEVIRNYFTSIVKNEYVVKSEIARTIIGASVKLILLLFDAPLISFIVALLFDTFLVVSGYCLAYTKHVGNFKEWNFNKLLVPYYLRQSFPLVLSGAAVIVYQKIDQVMIGNMINNESVGYFATAGKFLDVILFLPIVLSQTLTPFIVKIYQKNDMSVFYEKSYQFVSLVVWVAVMLAFFVCIIAQPLILYTFGNAYLPAVPILQIIVWKTVGMALSTSAGQIIIIQGIHKYAVIRNLLGCLSCVILNYFMLPKYGIIGSAWVTIITISISACLANILIPPYHRIFRLEIRALLCGWKELLQINKIIK